jgi:hypothetical protein
MTRETFNVSRRLKAKLNAFARAHFDLISLMVFRLIKRGFVTKILGDFPASLAISICKTPHARIGFILPHNSRARAFRRVINARHMQMRD